MKIAVSSSGKTLNSVLDPRFGRCTYFLVIDPADMSYEAFDNPGAAMAGGAGIQAAQFLADNSVDAVITGHVGPNSVQILKAAGIDVFAEQQGSIKEVVEGYKGGSFKPASRPTVDSHFGTGGIGFGGRGGRGMGRGGGRNPGQIGAKGQGQGKRS